MTNEILKKLQDIKKEINKSIQNKSIIKLPMYGNLVEDIKESLELVKNGHSQKEEIIKKLRNIYTGLEIECTIVQDDCLDSLKHSLANNEALSDKYSIDAAYKNLNIVVEALKLLYSVHVDKVGISKAVIPLDAAISLQEKMKKALEKMQQQQLPQSATNQGNDVNEHHDDANENEYSKLEEEAKTKFSKYIENDTIDGVSIGKYKDGDLCAIIKLQDNNNENASIKISEFLNSKFCTENNIAGFSILNGSQKEVIKGYIGDKRVRYYDLGTTAQYGIQFNWYVGEEKRSITLSANSDGSIKIVGDKPADEDLEKNKDVRIKVGDRYLSLASAVKTCKQNSQQRNENSASSKLNQPSADQVLPQERIASRK